MGNKYLLIVEGAKTEQKIFSSVLKKYGFNVTVESKKLEIDKFTFDYTNYEKDQKEIIIVQGHRNRIHDFLKLFDSNESDLDRLFSNCSNCFQGIFLIYDVDHNNEKDIEKMFNKFPEETGGLLLLSSPCIEVLGEYDHSHILKYNHLKEYKSYLNNFYNKNYGLSVEEYIIENFEELCLYYLEKNKEDFNEENIMEHPRLIIDKINSLNKRMNCNDKEKSYVIYNYLTTVVYVFIAYINGLTKEINNYSLVRDFFEKQYIHS